MNRHYQWHEQHGAHNESRLSGHRNGDAVPDRYDTAGAVPHSRPRGRPSTTARVESWELWSQPRLFIGYVVALVALLSVAAVTGLVTTPLRIQDLRLWLLLAGAGALCVEINRRADEPAGIVKDLLSAWTIPVVILLPPVWALLTPLPFTVVKQLRGRPGLVHRRVVSAAAIGLADAAGSTVFHRLLPPGSTVFEALRQHPSTAVGAAVVAAAVCAVANLLLIATAAGMAAPDASWRRLLGSRDDLSLDLGDTCAGLLVGIACAVTWLAAGLALPLVLLLHRCQSHAQLRAAARIDPKTGLLNAGAWQEEADREIVRATRERRPLAVLLADVDNFKAVNDSHGHLVGDQMLVLVAEALQAGLRSYDLLGRFGGEEFTVLLPNADRAEASRIAERLRHQVATAAITVDDAVLQVTVSIGGAVLGSQGADLTDLLTAADAALYHAKDAGRDKVVFTAG